MGKIKHNTFLCRAKLPVSTKWMYGCIIYRPKDQFVYMLENGAKWMHVINPQTVCRYSGFEDMHGVPIYENDIHEFNGKYFIVRFGLFQEHDEPCVGWYMEDSKDSSEQFGFSGNESDYANIVGNIFDNPDLFLVETPSER